QNVCRQLAKAGNFADTEIEFFRNDDVGCLAVLRVGFVPWAHGWMISFPPLAFSTARRSGQPVFFTCKEKAPQELSLERPFKTCDSGEFQFAPVSVSFSSLPFSLLA